MIRIALRWFLAAFFTAAGINHFRSPEMAALAFSAFSRGGRR